MMVREMRMMYQIPENMRIDNLKNGVKRKKRVTPTEDKIEAPWPLHLNNRSADNNRVG